MALIIKTAYCSAPGFALSFASQIRFIPNKKICLPLINMPISKTYLLCQLQKGSDSKGPIIGLLCRTTAANIAGVSAPSHTTPCVPGCMADAKTKQKNNFQEKQSRRWRREPADIPAAQFEFVMFSIRPNLQLLSQLYAINGDIYRNAFPSSVIFPHFASPPQRVFHQTKADLPHKDGFLQQYTVCIRPVF